ncbi:Regulatory protein NPR5 [Acorus calamus]|uniref:Regulatory protein NPR5 n=1 Tax=Acorus calamus TaxID=4465 RepID=A0AAV9F5D7_ACOCL|nr:Regulatory protein NPR5 [Acorus calamus]
MSMEETFKTLSLDYLNLLINGQAFSDVTFSVEGRLVHAHRCILAARSLFFRKFFCGPDSPSSSASSPSGLLASPRGVGGSTTPVIPVNSVTYEVFLLLLQFLYSGQASILPQKHEPRPNCGERGCWHTHCSSAVDLALDTLSASRSFGVEQLAILTQKQLASIVEKASIEDVMKVLLASRKQEMHHLWTTCSHLVAKSGLPPDVLAKHLPIDIVAKIEELRLNTEFEDQKIRRMRRALDSSDVELVKLMVMGEGLNLDEALALHYAPGGCEGASRARRGRCELPGRARREDPLHVAAEMVSPDMVAVLLDHHADPTVRTVDGVTPLDVLRSLTSDFLFKGAVPGLTHIEPNKLRLCLELVQSAAMVMSREETHEEQGGGSFYTPMGDGGGGGGGGVNLSLDSRIVYLDLGMAAAVQLGDGGDDGGGGGQRQGGEGGGGGGGIGHGMYSHDF